MTRAGKFLLNTDRISDLVRNPQGSVAARIVEVGQCYVLTSVVVAGELRFGARKKASATHRCVS